VRLALSIIGLALALGAASWFGWLTPANDILRDARFALDERQPSGGIVLVEIDPNSLEAVGVWPWPRRVHAEILNRLLDLGAAEVAFDIDFSVASTPEDDQLLEDALRDAGGYAMLAAFRQLPRFGEAPSFTEPLPRFSQHAPPVGVNVSTDNVGMVRRVLAEMDTGRAIIPSLPVAMSPDAPPIPSSEFLIDYSIDPDAVDRIRAADLLAGRVEADRIEDRQVVVGASALELRDVMMTPVSGALPGALIQILAAESVRQGRALLPPDRSHTLLLVVIGAAFALLLRKRLALPSGVGVTFGVIVLLEVAAFGLQQQAGLLVDTAATQLLLMSSLIVALGIEAFEKRMLHQEAARQRQSALERLAHAATYDELTGALTRSAFCAEIERAMRSDRVVTVVTIGLNRFDRINGALGFAVGDGVLRQVVERIRGGRDTATARVASDSFAVLLTDDIPLEPYCSAVRLALRQVFAVDTHEVLVGAHVGAATWWQADGVVPATTLLGRAELARGVAATTPNLPLVVHKSEMEEGFNAARSLELGLRDALANRELEVHFQGQFELTSGCLLGAEALARWNSPDLGQVPPLRFVSLAEETGLALPLGSYIFEEACKLAALWPLDLRVAVNVSPSQFEFGDVPALITRALELSNLTPDRLDVEITEGLLLNGSAATLEVLRTIREMGVGVAMDDFGTGYSSLSYLASLPINKLKIDQSFVRRLTLEARVDTVVEAVLTMCRKLDITSVAEGVESEQQAAWLREHRCSIAQGFLYHRPASATDFIDFALERGRRVLIRRVG
jgi:diguanylate cyclase (GGDEF)-like protein